MTTDAARGVVRVPIKFDPDFAVFFTLLGISPSTSFISVVREQVHVQMGWMGWVFRSRFPLSAVVAVSPAAAEYMSIGVHGFGGRWLVNGSGREIAEIQLRPRQRARLLCFPVKLEQLKVSVSDVAVLRAALQPQAN
jgi:hypothetical protein